MLVNLGRILATRVRLSLPAALWNLPYMAYEAPELLTKPGTSSTVYVRSAAAAVPNSDPDVDPDPALVVPPATFSPMAGLISPKPVSYMQHNLQQYNSYQRGVQGYPDLQANTLPPLSHPTPHQGVFLPGSTPNPTLSVNEESKIYALVIDLLNAEARESALLELSKKREQYDDLALVLWHSFGAYLTYTLPLTCLLMYILWFPGIMPALLQEIVSVYPLLSPPNLTAHVSNRVCNALALLQCVASHPETRQLFLNGTCAWIKNSCFRRHDDPPLLNAR